MPSVVISPQPIPTALLVHNLICIADHTAQGDPIPNSRYVRAFCETCNEPIRVTPERYQEWKRGAIKGNPAFPIRCGGCHGGSGGQSATSKKAKLRAE